MNSPSAVFACASSCIVGRESFAGSSSSLLRRSIPRSMHEKKHNVPTAVDGGSLHMPSNLDDADCAAAGMLHETMAAKINEIDRIRMARRITRKHSGIIARLFPPNQKEDSWIAARSFVWREPV